MDETRIVKIITGGHTHYLEITPQYHSLGELHTAAETLTKLFYNYCGTKKYSWQIYTKEETIAFHEKLKKELSDFSKTT